MRTPLNGLIGSMELLRRTATDDAQQELLSVMEASGDILLGHVNSVLDVSRAEAGMIHPDRVRFDPDRLLEETVANQAGLAAAAGNRITLSHPEGPLGPVMGDPGRLRQILLNLIGNAVKFTRNGDITVEMERLSTPDALVEIRVSDTGIGIAEADLDRIFEDFVTLDASYGRSAGGTGLGLGIARRLARTLGGEIGVESIEGEGSLFWLRLPLPPAALSAIGPDLQDTMAEAARTPSAPDPEEIDLGPPLSVLLVEDNAINRFLLRRFLESGGHRVTEAADGLEAVESAMATPFDVILMDISMPRMDGIAATQAIRAGQGPSRDTRILALTAHALPQELARFQAAGMEATLTKPIARLSLLRAVAGQQPFPQSPGLETTAAHALNPQGSGLPPTQAIEHAILADLIRHVGHDTAIHLITRLIAEGDATLAELATRQPETEAAEMAALCHRLVGSSGTFGTRSLHGALLAAETALKLSATHSAPPGAAPDVAARLAALGPVWQATRAGLSDALTRLMADPATAGAQAPDRITAP